MDKLTDEEILALCVPPQGDDDDEVGHEWAKPDKEAVAIYLAAKAEAARRGIPAINAVETAAT